MKRRAGQAGPLNPESGGVKEGEVPRNGADKGSGFINAFRLYFLSHQQVICGETGGREG